MPNLEDLMKRRMGVIPNPEAHKHPKLIGMMQAMGTAEAAVVVDYSEPSGIPEPPDEDQGSSGSCTEQAFCYGFFIHTGIQLSRQDGYSRIAMPGGGAFPNAPFDLMDSSGQYDRDAHKDPTQQTEANMTELVIVNDGKKRRMFKVHKWAVDPTNIDNIAYAIKRWKGVTGCYNVTWEGWADPSHPRPPGPNDTHYAGSHMVWHYDILLENGEKTIKAKSSWCQTVKNHFFKSNYYSQAGMAFAFYAMEVQELVMNEDILIINYKGKMGLAFFGGFTGNILFASSMDNLKKLCDVYGKKYTTAANGDVIAEFTIS